MTYIIVGIAFTTLSFGISTLSKSKELAAVGVVASAIGLILCLIGIGVES